MKTNGFARPTPKTVVVPWEDCVAKTYVDASGVRRMGISVRQHCVAVGYVCEALRAKMSASVRRFLPEDLAFWAAVHDVGKVSPGFQEMIGAILAGGAGCRDHSMVTEVAMAELTRGLFDRLPKMAGAHHGWYHASSGVPASDSYYGGPGWQVERKDLVAELERVFGPPSTKRMSTVGMQVTLNMFTVSDWIASDEKYFDPSVPMSDAELRKRAVEIVDSMGWEGFKFKRGMGFADMFPRIKAWNDSQKALCEIVRDCASKMRSSVVVLENSTGQGKTEAALAATYEVLSSRWGSGFRGMYFALPTRLTSNRIYTRVGDWLDEVAEDCRKPRLIHGQSRGHAPAGSGGLASNGAWFSSNRRAMLESFGVGTLDQALMAVMNVRFQYVRVAGLFRKVVVLDEVHSYDAYTGGLMESLVRQMERMGCVVIILSATLTRGAKARLLGVKESELSARGCYPKITLKRGGKVKEMPCGNVPQVTFDVEYRKRSDAMFDLAAKYARDGANVLWIENTVKDAAWAYERLKARLGPGVEVVLLHSRFLKDRRKEIEDLWMDRMGKGDGTGSPSRPAGCVFVATQVVEQSVDVDFDVLFTALCPSDFLVQRMGRIWRHRLIVRPLWLSRPRVHIMGPDYGGARTKEEAHKRTGISWLIYEPFLMMATARIWSRLSEVKLPLQTRGILEGTYAPAGKSLPALMRKLAEEMDARRREQRHEAVKAMSTHLPTRDDEGEDGVPLDATDSPPRTRKEHVPTRQLVLCRNIEFLTKGTTRTLRLTLYGGDVVEIPDVDREDMRKSDFAGMKDAAEKVERSMLKVVDSGVFLSYDPTMRPLGNAVYGKAVAVLADGFGEMEQVGGVGTMYRYTDECGAVRVDM